MAGGRTPMANVGSTAPDHAFARDRQRTASTSDVRHGSEADVPGLSPAHAFCPFSDLALPLMVIPALRLPFGLLALQCGSFSQGR